MAHLRRKSRSDVSGQELLPGIPDHITMQNIAPKITWKTCNVLRAVNGGWQQAIHNRSVYNSKVFSKSTEGFLILLHKDPKSKLVLILYSCKDGSSLQLPPPFQVTGVFSYDSICLDGKVYVWVVPLRKRSHISPCPSRVDVRVLDLAGDRRWTELKQLKLPFNQYYTYSYGVLNGKIYRFQGYVYPTRGVLDGGTVGRGFDTQAWSIRQEVLRLPQTEMYDPVSDVWSFVTPKPLKNAHEASEADLERHLASFTEWTLEQMAADISKKFLSHARYESYFSEWRRGRQATHDGKLSILDDPQHAMATQVYYRTPGHKNHWDYLEDFIFFRGKLLKFIRNPVHYDQRSGVIQMYDTEENEWGNPKPFSVDIKEDLSRWPFNEPWEIFDWAYADNAIWAIVRCGVKYLVRSPMFLKEEGDNPVTFIDTHYSMESFSPMHLRPIYISWQ